MTIAARQSAQNRMAEWLFSSVKEYANPCDDIELSAVFERPGRCRDGYPGLLGRWPRLGAALRLTQARPASVRSVQTQPTPTCTVVRGYSR